MKRKRAASQHHKGDKKSQSKYLEQRSTIQPESSRDSSKATKRRRTSSPKSTNVRSTDTAEPPKRPSRGRSKAVKAPTSRSTVTPRSSGKRSERLDPGNKTESEIVGSGLHGAIHHLPWKQTEDSAGVSSDTSPSTSQASTSEQRHDRASSSRPYTASRAETDLDFQSSLENIEFLLGELKQRRKERENDVERLEREKYQADSVVEESARKIIESVISLKERALHEIHVGWKDLQEKVISDLRKIHDAITSLEEDAKGIKCLLCNVESEVPVSIPQIQEHEKLGSRINTETGAGGEKETLHFQLNEGIEAQVEQIKSLGEVEGEFVSNPKLDKPNTALKEDSSELFDISGICILPGGTILLTDRTNEKLLRLDRHGNEVEQCKLPGRPVAICKTGPTEVAILLEGQQMVQNVFIAGRMKLERSFYIGEHCTDIDYHFRDIYLPCKSKDGKRPEIRVFSHFKGKFVCKLPQS